VVDLLHIIYDGASKLGHQQWLLSGDLPSRAAVQNLSPFILVR
jgi:hypothetical protein